MSDNRPPVYYDDNAETWVYRASFIGRGTRCLAAARQGYDPLPAPEYLIKAAEAGDRYERIVKAQMRVNGYKISGEQGSVEISVAPNVIVRGHMDGQHCVDPVDGTDRILEVKSMSERVYAKWQKWGFEKFETYAAQISTYMHAASLRRGEPVEATYAIVNRADDQSPLDIRTLTEPPIPWADVEQKILLAEWFATQHQLPVCGDSSDYQCPYAYLCDKNELIFEELEDGSEDMLNQLAEQHHEISELESDLKARKDLVRDEITTALGTRQKVDIPQWSFTRKPRTQKKLLAVELRTAMEAKGLDLDDFYETSETAPVLTVSKKKKR